jgi:murein DD-endopeptidase MepM/ murein hydrolase activator NlpD
MILPSLSASGPSGALAVRSAAAAACTNPYDVVSGDSWWAIANKASVSMSSLFAANNASASTPLFPGMQVCLPSGASAPTTTVKDSSVTTSPTSASGVSLAAFPAQGPCWYIDSWQAPRGGGRLHEGVDIMAKSGQYVYAAQDGKLTKQTLDRPGSLSGNAWWLTGDDGTYFFYAHLSAFAPNLKVGSKVVAGQVIGYVGSTGNASGAHLHFEVHPKGGAATNPTPIVRAVDGCRTSTPPPQPGGAVPPSPDGGATTTAPATTVPATTAPATTVPKPAAPTNTAPTTPAAGAAWQFISPKTAFDSSWNGGPLTSLSTRTITVGGLSGVPASTAGVIVRLTASDATSAGYVVVHPCDTGAPLTSVLNFRAGGGAVGSTMVRVSKGKICATSNTTVKLRVEVLATQSASGVGLQPIVATRVLDTRVTQRLSAGTQVQLANSVLGVPSGAQALTVAVTFVDPAASGTFSLGFCGQGPWKTPISADAVSSFAMTMRVSSAGWCLSSSVATDVVIDVTGIWAGSAKVATVDPIRIFDARSASGVGQTPVAVQVAGLGGVPSGATSALLSITLVSGGTTTSVFVHPCDGGRGSGAVVAAGPNRVSTAVVPVALSNGQVCVASIKQADVIVDVVGAG